MSILDEFERGERDAPPEVRDRMGTSRGTWHPICMCGHQRKYHSEEIGGTYPARVEEQKKRGKFVQAAHGCCGELGGRGRELTATTMVDGDVVETRIATCPCKKFHSVAEARDPRFRFRQRRPVLKGSTARDYAYQRHAFRTGIRATLTSIENLKRFRQFEGTDRMRAELRQQLFEDRFRWIDGARVCATKGCDRTEDVWPVYVAGDQSELRCPEHRDR